MACRGLAWAKNLEVISLTKTSRCWSARARHDKEKCAFQRLTLVSKGTDEPRDRRQGARLGIYLQIISKGKGRSPVKYCHGNRVKRYVKYDFRGNETRQLIGCWE